MKYETRVYRYFGKKQKKKIAQWTSEKVGLWHWIKLYFKLK